MLGLVLDRYQDDDARTLWLDLRMRQNDKAPDLMARNVSGPRVGTGAALGADLDGL
jgi:hypothetical protein